MRETRILEFKETITNTFLKTVSAFSNYDGGEILFGVDDDGNIKGLSDVKQACLDIENKINDSISPQPNYTLEIQNNEQTIKLSVKSGLQKPYLYKSKAYGFSAVEFSIMTPILSIKTFNLSIGISSILVSGLIKSS